LLKIKHLRTKTYTPKTNGQSRAIHSNFIARMGLNASPSGSTLTPRGGLRHVIAPPLRKD
jgi:hypothetical protein